MTRRISFCESIHATGASPWHVRMLVGEKKLGGGVDTPSLCGRVEVGQGWDLQVEPTWDRLIQNFVCQRCLKELHLMVNPELNKDRIARLLTWTRNPDPIEAIDRILSDLSETDLLHIMTFEKTHASRLAWIELGRRRGFGDFKLVVSQVEDVVELTFEAEAGPVIDSLALTVDGD